MSQNTPAVAGTSLVNYMAAKHGLEPTKFLGTLVKTVFPAPKGPNDPPPSNEQVAAFLVVAKQYDLNPFIKEIYAFPAKGGGIVPIVSLDGWSTLINRQPNLDGLEFNDIFDNEGILLAVTTIIYRKDRSHPTKVTEYLKECTRNTEPWAKWPYRMLRHKSLIQCARIAFGLAGIYDQDEGERIVETDGHIGSVVETEPITNQTKSEKLAEKLKKPEAPAVETVVSQPAEAIEVCSSCGLTNAPLSEIEGVMLCDNCKPKPITIPAQETAKPTEVVKPAKVAEPAKATSTPPWAKPKPAVTEQAPAVVVPSEAASLSLEDQVAEMVGLKPVVERKKPKVPMIKGLAMPEFVDRTGPEDSPSPEQLARLEEAFSKIPGEHGLGKTIVDWTGVTLEEINTEALEVIIEVLGIFIKPKTT